RAIACRTGLRELVLPQEHPDVLLVALAFQPFEEREDPEITAARMVQQKFPVLRRYVLPRRVQPNAARARRLTQQPAPSLMGGLGPRIKGALRRGGAPMGDNQGFVVLEDRPKTVARGTRATGVIKGKERGCEHRRRGAARRARGVLREPPAV